MDGDGDGVGDLKGIVSKLDYLNDGTEKSLGIDAIWLSPIYPSPNKDFGYDISDYRDIDPLYGSMDDFKVLLREAHDRNIRIVMDLVINHTSDQHPWFVEACKSRDNPHHDWYLWHEGKNGKVAEQLVCRILTRRPGGGSTTCRNSISPPGADTSLR